VKREISILEKLVVFRERGCNLKSLANDYVKLFKITNENFAKNFNLSSKLLFYGLKRSPLIIYMRKDDSLKLKSIRSLPL